MGTKARKVYANSKCGFWGHMYHFVHISQLSHIIFSLLFSSIIIYLGPLCQPMGLVQYLYFKGNPVFMYFLQSDIANGQRLHASHVNSL